MTTQLLRVPEISLKFHPKIVYDTEDAGGKTSQPERFYKQDSAAWRDARKGKSNGSKAAGALGWRERKATGDYAEEVRTGEKPKEDLNDARIW